ncbi:MAG: glycoside hydrolase family 15 protein [Candidatus Altiarchaeota archaeon]|nr:glycoside hydrolase family 15 protein [Candidatus Altiarchaeota archaeon]
MLRAPQSHRMRSAAVGPPKEEIDGKDLIEAILPPSMPANQSVWPSRESYKDWLLTGRRQQHAQIGASLATDFMKHAVSPQGLGLSLPEAYYLLMGNPGFLMKVTKLPITFIPQYRFGLMKAGSMMWDEIERSGAGKSFKEIGVDREVFSYAVAKLYSKTRADGSIAAGSSLDNERSYGYFGWARDSGLVSDAALSRAMQQHNRLLLNINHRQVQWLIDTQGDDGRFSQRVAIHTSVFDSPDQRRGKSKMWADPQIDGTAAVVCALADYVDLTTAGQTRALGSHLVHSAYRSIRKAANYLANAGNMTWCAWEEVYDQHFHSDAHVIQALDRVLSPGSSGEPLVLTLIRNGEMVNVERIRAKAGSLRAGVGDYLNITEDDRKWMEVFIGRKPGKDEVWIKPRKCAPGCYCFEDQDQGPINSTAIEAVVETGVLPLDHPSVLGTILLMDEISAREAPKVNSIADPNKRHHVMWVRYPGDQFDPELDYHSRGATHGHLWSICTMWPAQHAYRLAHDYLEDGKIVIEHARQVDFLNRALEVSNGAPLPKMEVGEDGSLKKHVVIERAKDPKLFDTIISGVWGWGDRRFSEITRRFNPHPSGIVHMTEDLEDRRIPEQYNRETGEPYGERSLTWGYREFLKAVEYRADLLGDWLRRPMAQ